MDKLFENIGEKIKALAKVVFVIGILISVIGGLVSSIALGSVMHGFAILVFFGSVVVGVIAAYISSMFLYGFGELISNSKKLVENGNAPQEFNSNTANTNISAEQQTANVSNNTTMSQPATKESEEKEAEPNSNEWKCPKCGKIHQNYVGTCGCGEKKP